MRALDTNVLVRALVQDAAPWGGVPSLPERRAGVFSGSDGAAEAYFFPC